MTNKKSKTTKTKVAKQKPAKSQNRPHKSHKKGKLSFKAKAITSLVIASIFTVAGFVVYLGWFIPRGFINIGMNIGRSNYYFSRVLMFNDIMKTKHTIRTRNGWYYDLPISLADDGYPAGITYNAGGTQAVIILINNIYSGDYVFLYDGDGDFEFAGNIEVLSTEPQKIHLRLKEPENISQQNGADHRYVIMRRSNPNDHARNFRMIPKQYEFNEHEMPLFRKDFLDGLKNTKALRFMGAMDINSSTEKHWSERPKTTDWTYDTHGLPLEYLIELSNTVGADAWFCVPHKASDDYITQMAKLIKSKLNKNLKCYIEYSNETWHSGFPQGEWIENNAPDAVDSYVSTDLASLRSPRYGNDTRHLKTAYMMSRTFRLFQNEFTGAARTRLVTVGTRYFWEYPREIIEYLIEQNTRPDVMADSGYFNFTRNNHLEWNKNPSTVKPIDIINAVLSTWQTREQDMAKAVEIYNEFNIPYIVYEGGQHMQPQDQQVWEYNQAVWDAQIHPKMYELYMKNFRMHTKLGCKLFMHFGYIGERESRYGSWGALENTRDVYAKNLKSVSPKYQAILDANTRKGLFR